MVYPFDNNDEKKELSPIEYVGIGVLVLASLAFVGLICFNHCGAKECRQPSGSSAPTSAVYEADVAIKMPVVASKTTVSQLPPGYSIEKNPNGKYRIKTSMFWVHGGLLKDTPFYQYESQEEATKVAWDHYNKKHWSKVQ